MLSDLDAREALHVLVLKKLEEVLRPNSFALKGGVNLRLFFGSVRYSEDMDLDVEPQDAQVVVRRLGETLQSAWLHSRLRAVGLVGLEYSGRPYKSTETTVRLKMHVLGPAGIGLPTKIEMSLRPHAPDEVALEEIADDGVVRKYLAPASGVLRVSHYPQRVAIRQKISALARRSSPEARDIFDLHHLAGGKVGNVDLAFLGSHVSHEELHVARQRVWALGYDLFRSQVVEFLSETDRLALGTPAAWEERQQFTLELIEAVELSAPADPATGGET